MIRPPIKAIETEYRGHLFRSRLEARWAVFFDALGLHWLYEHQGYETPDGPYLPDFFLPKPGVIVEVKPVSGCVLSHARLRFVADALGARAVIANEIPENGDDWGVASDRSRGVCCYPHHYCDSDFHFGDFMWCVCPWCGSVDLGRWGESPCSTCRDPVGLSDGEWSRLHDIDRIRHEERLYERWGTMRGASRHPRLLAAYRAARSARFEYGHRGATL